MLPLGSARRRDRPRPAIMVLMALTFLAVPITIWDMVSGDDPGDSATVEVADSATSTTAPPSEAAASDESAEAPPVTVALDASWLAKGTSRYSDSDSDTLARINRNNSAATTSTTTPTSLVDGTSDGVDDQPNDEAPVKSVPQTTAAQPTKTTPKTTAAPQITAAPPTTPKPTAAPTTTAAPPKTTVATTPTTAAAAPAAVPKAPAVNGE